MGDGRDIIYNYYWREYNGVVPSDAVPGGHDLNNKTTYIGQGMLGGSGIIPTNIYPGETTITVPYQGVKTITSHIKILCSPQTRAFQWVPVKAEKFLVEMINKHVVPGGVENYSDTKSMLNIGRIFFEGQVVVGKINTASPNTPGLAPMYFVNKNTEKVMKYYEVLVYDPTLNFWLDVKGERM